MTQGIGFTVALRHVWLWSLLMGAYACLALLRDRPPFSYLPNVPQGLNAAASLAVGMLLAFRMNKAYERWWEARKQWGQLVNACRNLAVKIRELVKPDEIEAHRANSLITAFCYALMDHLRDDFRLDTIVEIADGDDPPKHEPSYVVGKIYALFHRWRELGRINDQTLWMLDREARVFLDVCGACERIKYTLMSQSWRAFARQSLVIYLLVIPWGLTTSYGVLTIPLTIIVSYFVIGGEGIAHYVEEPFGHHEDHLDLESICNGIKNTTSEILGSTPSPRPPNRARIT